MRTSLPHHYQHHSKEQGFSMIEILITVVVSSFGLLGIAGLQLSSIKSSTHASINTQTMISINEIVGRIHANTKAAKAGEFNIATANNQLITATAMTAPTTTAKFAEKATYNWLQNLNKNVPNVKAGIYCTTAGRCAIKVELPMKASSNAASNMTQVVSFQL